MIPSTNSKAIKPETSPAANIPADKPLLLVVQVEDSFTLYGSRITIYVDVIRNDEERKLFVYVCVHMCVCMHVCVCVCVCV